MKAAEQEKNETSPSNFPFQKLHQTHAEPHLFLHLKKAHLQNFLLSRMLFIVA